VYVISTSLFLNFDASMTTDVPGLSYVMEQFLINTLVLLTVGGMPFLILSFRHRWAWLMTFGCWSLVAFGVTLLVAVYLSAGSRHRGSRYRTWGGDRSLA
jgi:hypothetical protein